MCRSKNDPCGQRRCPSSDVRRQRRKALETVKHEQSYVKDSLTPAILTETSYLSESIKALKGNIASLRERIYDSSSAEEDSALELGLLEIGSQFIAEVDKIVEISEDKMYLMLDEELGKIFDAPENIDRLKHELQMGEFSAEERARREAEVSLTEDMIAREEEYVSEAEQRIYKTVSESYREAYISVLSKLRPLGAERSNLLISDEYSSTNLDEMLDDTVFSYYPSAWLKRHAESSVMYVESDPENPNVHYNRSTPDSRGELGKPAVSYKHLLTDAEGREFLHSNVLHHYSIVADGTIERAGESSSCVIMYDLPEEELVERSEDYRPDGEGWEYRTSMSYVLSSGFSNEEEFKTAAIKKMWVRRVSNESEVINRLNFYPSETVKEASREDMEAVLYHEFAHRFEDVLPDNVLPRMERAFLLRRTGKSESEEHHKMIRNIVDGSFYHRADFVDHYVGREYFTRDSYEVLSTGVEAVFGGKFSSLIGLDANYPRRDEDHRKFTLGALAVL